MEYFPFIHEKKKKVIEQIPIYIEIPEYVPQRKEEKEESTVIIIELL